MVKGVFFAFNLAPSKKFTEFNFFKLYRVKAIHSI